MRPMIVQEWPEPSGADLGDVLDEHLDTDAWRGVAVTMVVRGMVAGMPVELYYSPPNGLKYPFNPIVCVPWTGATEMDLYIALTNAQNVNYYYRKHIKLHQSDSWGCSYYIDFGRNGWRVMQVTQYNEVQNSNPIQYTAIARDDWESVTRDEYRSIYEKGVSGQYCTLPVEESVLKVSEVDNPLVFPSAAAVQVGAGKIIGMASNTEEISVGQYGDYLYVFTDEGVWALSVDRSNGTYSSTHHISRDVLKSTTCITPIDKGVLITSSRGVLLLSGNSVVCLSDGLRGKPWQMSVLPHAEEAAGGAAYLAAVSYEDLLTFLDGARMLYDYTNQRVYIFKGGVPYAYVYSLRSGLWGACESLAVDVVNSFPNTYCVLDREAYLEVVNVGVSSDSRQHVLCCTRPLSFGAPHVHKSLMSAVVRGLFHGRGSGEKSRVGCVVWGSNDLYHWYAVMSSNNQYLRGRIGTPYQYWRIGIVGSLDENETLDGVTFEVRERLNNRIR